MVLAFGVRSLEIEHTADYESDLLRRLIQPQQRNAKDVAMRRFGAAITCQASNLNKDQLALNTNAGVVQPQNGDTEP